MKKFFVILGVVIVGVAGWLLISATGQRQNTYSKSDRATQTPPATTSDKAPDFHLQDYGGKMVKRGDFFGKPVVINAWASWCPFCRQELHDFAAVQKEFADKAVIIAIDRAESLGVAKGYTDQQGTTDKLIFLLDPSDSFYQSIGGFSMPETIFVDKDGNIVEHKRGPMDISEMRTKIQKLLQQ